MKHSDQMNEIAAALAKAQEMMKPAHKDSVNPAYRSKYADLPSVWEAWRTAGPANGLATVQDVTAADGTVAVTTTLIHTSGQWLEFGPLLVPMAKSDAHGVGSATTYGRRFGLSAAVGMVADDDDDGNAAVGTDLAKPLPGRYRGKGPVITRPAEEIGRPERRAPLPEEQLAREERDAFGEDEKVTAERKALLAKAKKLAKALNLSPQDRDLAWETDCGEATQENVDPAAVASLVARLQAMADKAGVKVDAA